MILNLYQFQKNKKHPASKNSDVKLNLNK